MPSAMTSDDFKTGLLRSRADLGIASRRIVRATAVSTRPGCALALMPRRPIQINVTSVTIAMITTSKTNAFTTAFMSFPAAFLQKRRWILDEFVAIRRRAEVVHLPLVGRFRCIHEIDLPAEGVLL